MTAFLLIVLTSLVPAGVYGAYHLSAPGRLRSKLRKQKKRSDRLTKTSKQNIEQAKLEFKRTMDIYVENYRMDIAKSLPIDSLKAFGANKVRWAALKNSGYSSFADFQRMPEVTYIQGVGSGSADSLKVAAENATLAINSMEVPEPKAGGQYGADAVLIAAQQQLDASEFSEQLRAQISDFNLVSEPVESLRFRDWLSSRQETTSRAEEAEESVGVVELSLEKMEQDWKKIDRKPKRVRPELREQILELIAELVPGGMAARALYGALTNDERNSVGDFPP